MSSLVALWWTAAAASDETWVNAPLSLAERPPNGANRAPLVAEDAALVASLQRGDENAFRQCYEVHYPTLWRFAVRLVGSHDVAHDVVQDVFVALFSAREALIVRNSLRTYLFGAVRHRALNLLRHDQVTQRLTRHVSLSEAATHELPALGTAPALPSEAAEQQDIEARVLHALDTLPERQRAAMILRWEHQLSTAEIARTLGVADTVARRLLLKAAANLRRALTGAR